MINRIDAYSGKTFSLYLRQPRQSLNLEENYTDAKLNFALSDFSFEQRS